MGSMMVVKDALYALDTMEREPTPFEVELLETMTRQTQVGRLPSTKQHRILCEMVERYLSHDPALLQALLKTTAD